MAAGARIPARLAAEGYAETAEHVGRLARFDLDGTEDDGRRPVVSSVAVPGGTVEMYESQALDPAEGERRRATRADAVRADIARAEGKLANQAFVRKAPPAVVDAEREKLVRLTDELRRLVPEP